MPGRDGTGPLGNGPMTGRGFGFCSGAKRPAAGFGMGCRFGFGRGFGFAKASSMSQKELLEARKAQLQSNIEAIDRQLESL